jgi:hypothetical protein
MYSRTDAGNRTALKGGEEVRGVLEGIEQTYGGIFAFKYLI